MAKTIKKERIRWVVPIVQKQIKLVDATKEKLEIVISAAAYCSAVPRTA